MIFKRHTQKSICAEGGQLISMTQMSVPMVRKHNISASFLLTMCFICHPAIAETWRCEPREGFEKIGSRAPKELYFSEIPMLNFTIHNGELNGTIVSDDPYSFSLRSNYTSARYRTFSDVSRWTTHVFKMHGTFNVGSVVEVRRSFTNSYEHTKFF
ncbi:MAG: hypothetical protein EBX04_11615 [Rhodobacteraceae bacterium]|nr:hypothetical protein [Paracoccaceae bacterium]